MAPHQQTDPSSLSASFETIFQWDMHWTSIHVRPVTNHAEFIHFKVTLSDGSFVYLWKDPEFGWEEGRGQTGRSKVLGEAIDNYYCTIHK